MAKARPPYSPPTRQSACFDCVAQLMSNVRTHAAESFAARTGRRQTRPAFPAPLLRDRAKSGRSIPCRIIAVEAKGDPRTGEQRPATGTPPFVLGRRVGHTRR